MSKTHYPGADAGQPTATDAPGPSGETDEQPTKEETTMNDLDRFFEGMRSLAEETGIPFEQLMKMRHSELQPIFEFARIKVDLRIATKQKDRDRLMAEHQQWLDMHPLWRAHLEAKKAL